MRTGTDHTECLRGRRPGSGHPVGVSPPTGGVPGRGSHEVGGGTPERRRGGGSMGRETGPVQDSEETT
jgi:hypothetical protein